METPDTSQHLSEKILPFLDHAPDFFILREPNGKILEINTTFAKIMGIPREQILGRSMYDFYAFPEQRETGAHYTETVLKTGLGRISLFLRTQNDRIIETEMRGCLVTYDGKKSIFGIGREIGEEGKDARLVSLFRAAFRRSNEIMFYSDRNGIILDVNDAFIKHYGYTREEAVGRKPRILRSQHSTDALYKRMWENILDPEKGFWRGEIINRAKDGREIPLLLTITAVQDSSGDTIGYISNAIDTSEHRALEERIADARALADIGEMATIIAHEIRNPLGSVINAAKQLANDDLSHQERETIVKILQNEGLRLNETLTGFLTFARSKPIHLKHADLNALIGEVSELVRQNKDIAPEIKLEICLDGNIHPFLFDPDQILQVAWNLTLNAVQAMNGKGTLTVKSGRSGNFVYVAIGDTGPGIDETAKVDLFKPFRTTKQKGTGLGLAVADRICRAHGGRIEVESRLGKGSLFIAWLPYMEE